MIRIELVVFLTFIATYILIATEILLAAWVLIAFRNFIVLLFVVLLFLIVIFLLFVVVLLFPFVFVLVLVVCCSLVQLSGMLLFCLLVLESNTNCIHSLLWVCYFVCCHELLTMELQQVGKCATVARSTQSSIFEDRIDDLRFSEEIALSLPLLALRFFFVFLLSRRNQLRIKAGWNRRSAGASAMVVYRQRGTAHSRQILTSANRSALSGGVGFHLCAGRFEPGRDVLPNHLASFLRPFFSVCTFSESTAMSCLILLLVRLKE